MKYIIEQLDAFQPQEPKEARCKEFLLDAVNSFGASLLVRENQQAHFTASAIILNHSMTQVMMVYHHIYQSFSWVGGHMDGDCDFLAVALKEAKEETGIEKIVPLTLEPLSIEILPVKAHTKKRKKVPPHDHYNVSFGFICADHEKGIVKPDENSAVEWIAIDALETYCTEAEMVPLYQRIIHRMQNIQREKNEQYKQLPVVLLDWYAKNARILPWRDDKAPYHVWLSEIMLQQTRVDTVIAYYQRFLKELPTIQALAMAPQEKVLKLWEGLGYYSRAKNLQKAAQMIMCQYEGKFPTTPKEILSLPGIGAYTAGAIASICFEEKMPAVDGNVLRVISRITEDYRCIDIEETKKQIATTLAAVYPEHHRGDFTQSLMELGATICVPNGTPRCIQCPAMSFCTAFKQDRISLLPVRKEKKEKKEKEMTVFLFLCDEQMAIRKRLDKGVLKDLWEFPNIEHFLSEEDLMQYVKQWDTGNVNIVKAFKEVHVFTHLRWQMHCYVLQCEKTFGDFVWTTAKQMEDEFSLPTAFKKLVHVW